MKKQDLRLWLIAAVLFFNTGILAVTAQQVVDELKKRGYEVLPGQEKNLDNAINDRLKKLKKPDVGGVASAFEQEATLIKKTSGPADIPGETPGDNTPPPPPGPQPQQPKSGTENALEKLTAALFKLNAPAGTSDTSSTPPELDPNMPPPPSDDPNIPPAPKLDPNTPPTGDKKTTPKLNPPSGDKKPPKKVELDETNILTATVQQVLALIPEKDTGAEMKYGRYLALAKGLAITQGGKLLKHIQTKDKKLTVEKALADYK